MEACLLFRLCVYLFSVQSWELEWPNAIFCDQTTPSFRVIIRDFTVCNEPLTLYFAIFSQRITCWKYGLGFPQTSEWAGWTGNDGSMTWCMSVEVMDTGTDW